MSRWLPLTVLLILTTAGCQSVLPDRGSSTDRADEMERLRQTVLELQRQARMNEVELARLRRQVAELAERQATAAEGPTDSPATLQPPAPAAASPAGEPETPAPAFPAATDGLEEEDLDMTEPAAPPVEPAGEPEPVGADGQALYDHGYTLYHQGRYVDAESSFQTFLQRFGSSDLADNAQFWIGESRFRRGDLNGALAAFRETVIRFPRGNKVPDALFRSGDCLEELGDLDGARAAWRQTIDRFPSSAAAALSEERLDAVP